MPFIELKQMEGVLRAREREDYNNENPVRTLNRRHVLLAGVKVGCGLIKNTVFSHHAVGELIPTNRLAGRSEILKCFFFFVQVRYNLVHGKKKQ